MKRLCRWTVAALAAVALAQPARKPHRRALVSAAEIESRLEQAPGALENARALASFFERLRRGETDGPVHILHFGDSHSASDTFPGALRREFQTQFGDGGPGFTPAGHPYRGYRRFDSRGAQSEGWRTNGIIAHESDSRNGLAGFSITAERRGEVVSLEAESERLALFYLRQPGGGDFEFVVDGESVERVTADGETGSGYFEYTPSPGPHRFAVRTLTAGPVRLFGWTADNGAGITYENLGINGAQATVMLGWAEDLWAEHVARRDPALVVVAYGTNEAVSPRWDPAAYSAAFRQVLKRIRRAAPSAAILVIGPPDCLFAKQTHRMSSARLGEVIAIERGAARECRCAFWNWRGRMGGAGSVRGWVEAGLSQADHVHMTAAGYRLAGKLLFEELMLQYERFMAAHPAPRAQEENEK